MYLLVNNRGVTLDIQPFKLINVKNRCKNLFPFLNIQIIVIFFTTSKGPPAKRVALKEAPKKTNFLLDTLLYSLFPLDALYIF